MIGGLRRVPVVHKNKIQLFHVEVLISNILNNIVRGIAYQLISANH